MEMTFTVPEQYEEPFYGIAEFGSGTKVTKALGDATVEFIRGNIITASYPTDKDTYSRDNQMAELADWTKKAKGHSTIGRDTDTMLNSIAISELDEKHVRVTCDVRGKIKPTPSVRRERVRLSTLGLKYSALKGKLAMAEEEAELGGKVQTQKMVQAYMKGIAELKRRGKEYKAQKVKVAEISKAAEERNKYPQWFHFGSVGSDRHPNRVQPERPFMIVTERHLEETLGITFEALRYMGYYAPGRWGFVKAGAPGAQEKWVRYVGEMPAPPPEVRAIG